MPSDMEKNSEFFSGVWKIQKYSYIIYLMAQNTIVNDKFFCHPEKLDKKDGTLSCSKRQIWKMRKKKLEHDE